MVLNNFDIRGLASRLLFLCCWFWSYLLPAQRNQNKLRNVLNTVCDNSPPPGLVFSVFSDFGLGDNNCRLFCTLVLNTWFLGRTEIVEF